MVSKSMAPEKNAAVRAYARAWVEQHHPGNVKRAAEALGVAQAFFAEFLAGKRGAGMKLLTALQTATGVTMDQLLGGAPPKPAPPDTEGMDEEKAAAYVFASGLYAKKAVDEVIFGHDLGGGAKRGREDWLAMIRVRALRLKEEEADAQVAEQRVADSGVETARQLAALAPLEAKRDAILAKTKSGAKK